MARVVKLVSDISGNEAPETEFISLVVRQHPEILSPRQLDVLPTEVADWKGAENLVIVEIKNNGESKELVMSHADFKKLVPDAVVKKAPGTRGRKLGSTTKKA